MSDYDIFPTLCNKAAVYRIFHTMAFMNCIISPDKPLQEARVKLSEFNVSVMSP